MKYKSFGHQQASYDHSKDFEAYGLLWEQGTGKTKTLIDTARHLYRAGKIDAVVVVAPNEVHRNWIEDELPKWAGEGYDEGVYWESGKAGTQRHKRTMEHALHQAKFPVVAMAYQGFMTKRATLWLKRFFKKRSVLLILDEAHLIKSPGAKRTMRAVAAGRHAAYRRIATGTPVTNSPFDIYSQIKFLDNGFWKKHGILDYTTFKAYFGIWKQGINTQGERDREYKFVVAYRNLDELHEMIQPITNRVLKCDVLDLPPKLYSKRYFDLTTTQARVYAELRDHSLAFLESGELMTVDLALTVLLRLSQVTSNFLPFDEESGQVKVPVDSEVNPRLACLDSICESLTHPTIIWAKYREDIDQIMLLLKDKAVRYDGRVNSDGRAESKKAFKDGKVQFFVANPAVGATGLTLTEAQTVIYYNNSYKLTDRLQSEDRAHRIGQEHPVNYIDIVASGTIDEKIIVALQCKVNLASEVTGDELKEWI